MIAQSLADFAHDTLQPRILPAYRKPFLRSDEPRYILRLISLRTFDMDRFPWLHPEHDPVRAGRAAEGLPLIRGRLVEEAAAWIDETTEWRMQKALEADTRCFETLAAHLLAREATCPHLARPLREALDRPSHATR